MDSKTLQETIHINFILLYNKGHNIEFQEGMFKEPNLPGFEKVAYALSLVISAEEAKKSIPWPLLDDKKLRSEFRLKFSRFIKTINAKYDAKIPELSASNFQYPGGLMFLNFMYRLSTFAVELELKRMMSPEEKGELLERYDLRESETDLQEVCTNICLGRRYEEEEKMLAHAEYQAEAVSTIRELEEGNKFLEDMTKSSQAKLQSSLTDLDVDEGLKERLLDITSNEVMEDWNERTKVKIEELKLVNKRLCKVSDLTTSVTQMIRTSAGNHKESICLDGSKLKVTHSLSKFTNLPVRNNRGDVKLETLFDAGLAAVSRLASSSPPQPSQLPWARELETEVPVQRERARKCSAVLNTLETTFKTEIAVLRPILYESVRNKKRPEWFSCLSSLPLVPLVLPNFLPSGTNDSTLKKDRKRRLSSILKLELQNKKKKTKNVRTSFKLKGPFLHPLMTPRLQTHQPRACSTALRAAPGLSGSTALTAASGLSGSTAHRTAPAPSSSTADKSRAASGSSGTSSQPHSSSSSVKKGHQPRACSTALRAAPRLSGSTALKAASGLSGSTARRTPPAPSSSTADVSGAASGSSGTSGQPHSSSSFVKKGRPSLPTIYKPSCKRSLYGKLPTGKRPTEDDSMDLSDVPECPPLSMISEDFNDDKPGKVGQRRSDDGRAGEKHKRRSIDLIIQRYKQHKAKMNETANGSQC